jgi:hypothetical protein
MLLLSLALVIGAFALYMWVPSLFIHSQYPWPVYLLLIASVAAAARSGLRRVWRYTATAVTAVLAGFFVVVTLTTGLDHGRLAVQPGDPFPAFTLQTSTKQPFSSESQKGHNAALYIFYRGDW